MMKKTLLVSGIIALSLILVSVPLYKANNKSNYIDLNKKGSQIAMYIEGDDGEYTKSQDNRFPTGGYVLDAENSSCTNGGVLSQDKKTKAISLSTSSQEACTLYFKKETLSGKTLAALGITSNTNNPDFTQVATTDEGVFSMDDDYGVSYYFRGAIENNYVRFGKNKDNQDMYWRIIRINGNGTLRVIYDGTSAHENVEESEDRIIGYSKWNNKGNDVKYVGYMYGPANEVEGATTPSTSKEQAQTNTASSTMKEYLNTWYQKNIIETGYSSYVSDTLFCNDRSTTGPGYGKEYTTYNVNNRINSGSPQLKCPKNDAFTVSDEIGNKALATANPIGLITSDEAMMAGGQRAKNYKYYLYKGLYYWTFSPSGFYTSDGGVFVVNEYGRLEGYYVNDAFAVAPVINLSTEFVENITGDGTRTNPYHLSA